ncbi:MAG: hypothetical protein C4K58_00045 [Flavobacteriaceae bacterium]|nr:MAG: hypothetical protein C4K58_00045 [Flavobacteriaceae bacterium]
MTELLYLLGDLFKFLFKFFTIEIFSKPMGWYVAWTFTLLGSWLFYFWLKKQKVDITEEDKPYQGD